MHYLEETHNTQLLYNTLPFELNGHIVRFDVMPNKDFTLTPNKPGCWPVGIFIRMANENVIPSELVTYVANRGSGKISTVTDQHGVERLVLMPYIGTDGDILMGNAASTICQALGLPIGKAQELAQEVKKASEQATAATAGVRILHVTHQLAASEDNSVTAQEGRPNPKLC